jgi:hypothetical protein
MNNFDTFSSTSDVDHLFEQIMGEKDECTDVQIDSGLKNKKLTDRVAIMNWDYKFDQIDTASSKVAT